MDSRIIELDETAVCGISKQFDGDGYKNKEELRHIMWSEDCDDVPGKICTGRWNEPGNHSYDGVWYGIWQGGKYMIAREKADAKNGTLYANELSSFELCREYNLGRGNLLRGRELAEYLQTNIQLFGKAIPECMEYFDSKKIFTNEEKRPYTENLAKEKIKLTERLLE
ncbi:MAG: hypothetical protein GX851_03465 [Clostridiales bacterium]|nr:hypothetical protein [Clostridiales bacterium]